MTKIKLGADGIHIPMVGENDLFVPWSVVKQTILAVKESRKSIDKLPWGIRHIVRKATKSLPLTTSAVNTIIETASCVNVMGGRIIWKEKEYEEHAKTLVLPGE